MSIILHVVHVGVQPIRAVIHLQTVSISQNMAISSLIRGTDELALFASESRKQLPCEDRDNFIVP